jgi:hydroxyacid-oxoacid transhydrogenase
MLLLRRYASPISQSQAIAALESQTDLPFEVYDQTVAEPTEESWRNAIAWARKHDFSHFLA